MGSNPATFFASLFLYYYQKRFIKNTGFGKQDLEKARKLWSAFRFIDDLN